MKPTIESAYQLMHEGSLALAEVEANGLRVDTAKLDQTLIDTTKQIEVLTADLKKDPVCVAWRRRFGDKTSLGSRQQLATILKDEFDIKLEKKTKSGNDSMDVDALEGVDLPFAKAWIRVEKLKKLKGTYLLGLKREVVDGLAHPSFSLHLVKSYRSSADGPNIQNQIVRDKETAKLLRQCYIPRDGCVLTECDYGALEFRGAACVIGSTPIETIDGPQTMKLVAERICDGESVYVYGYNHEKGRLAVAKALEGGVTRRNAEVWRVTLDNGESVVATPDHRFMLRDGTYRSLWDLVSGDSLMPFYSRHKKSRHGTVYTEINLNNGRMMMAHNLIALDVLGDDIRVSKNVVHHDDGNGTNNSLDNIEVMSRSKHMSIHATQGWSGARGRERKEQQVIRNKSDLSRRRLVEMNARRKEEWTQEQWDQMRENQKEGIRVRGGHKGKRNPMFGKHHSESAKAKQRRKKIGYMPKSAGWNKGLTAETNESIRQGAAKQVGRTPHNKGKKVRVLIRCEWCNKEMWVTPCIAKRKRFCSYHCCAMDRNREGKNPLAIRTEPPKNKGTHWERSTGRTLKDVEVVCEWCGKKFMQIEGREKKFCSHSCSAHNMNFLRKKRNHKVVSVEFVGYEDVYNITVDKIHNYVTSAGVVVKNCFWNDERMIEYASNPSLDIHRDVAAKAYMLSKDDVTKDARYCGKNKFVFPTLYGSDYINCSKNLWDSINEMNLKTKSGIPLRKWLEEQGIDSFGSQNRREKPENGTFVRHIYDVEQWFCGLFSQWRDRREQWVKRYQARGWFPLMTGFRCSGIFSKNQLMNIPVQGPCFHALLWSLIRVLAEIKKRKMRTKVVAEIHDSIVADVPREEIDEYFALTKQIMEKDVRNHWDWIKTPLIMEPEVCFPSWYEKVPWKLGMAI